MSQESKTARPHLLSSQYIQYAGTTGGCEINLKGHFFVFILRGHGKGAVLVFVGYKLFTLIKLNFQLNAA